MIYFPIYTEGDESDSVFIHVMNAVDFWKNKRISSSIYQFHIFSESMAFRIANELSKRGYFVIVDDDDIDNCKMKNINVIRNIDSLKEMEFYKTLKTFRVQEDRHNG